MSDTPLALASSPGRNGVKARSSALLARWQILLVLSILLFALYRTFNGALGYETSFIADEPLVVSTKPDGLRVVGLVFVNRVELLPILTCYLKRNLVTNDGWLDEVVFYSNTHESAALEDLMDTVRGEPLYRVVEGPLGYKNAYKETVRDRNTIYVRLDDDLVWLADDAIPLLVKTLLANPSAYLVLGNLATGPIIGPRLWHKAAFHPYLPEPGRARPPTTRGGSWRPSQLPLWSNETSTDWTLPPSDDIGQPNGPPADGHRWLSLPPDHPTTDEELGSLVRTPYYIASKVRFDRTTGPGSGITWWTVVAQQHYSFLQNLENATLSNYMYGGNHGLYNTKHKFRCNVDTQYRYTCSLNLAAFRGATLMKRFPTDDDEQVLTNLYPREARRPVLVQTQALAAHYSFRPITEALHSTDLLERYAALARELACTKRRTSLMTPASLTTVGTWSSDDEVLEV